MGNIEEIKAERQRRGLSQWALAVRVGRSGAWLSLRESGYVPTSLDELEALSEALRQIGDQQTANRSGAWDE